MPPSEPQTGLPLHRVLITGGAGFIGSHLAEALLARGSKVVLLDNLHPQVHPGSAAPLHLPAAARLEHCDINETAALAAAVSGCDVVYHLAAETGTGQSMYEPARYVRTNVEGTAALIEAVAATAGPRPRVVLAASRAVYGEGTARCDECRVVHPGTRTAAQLATRAWEPVCPRCGGGLQPQPTGEGAPLRPASVYGVSKLAQEELLRVASEAGVVDAWALRLQNVFGARQSLANPYTGLLAVFVNRLRAGQPCELFEDGECTRDFVHVADVVEALVAAGQRRASSYEVVNIGSGRPTTVRQVALSLMALLHDRGELAAMHPAPVVTGAYRAGDIRHATADVSRAEELLGWRPRTSLEHGLAEFVDWALASPAALDESERALDELRHRGLGR